MQKSLVTLCSAGVLLAASALHAQAPAAAPTFDVASIKPSAPITPEMVQSGRLHAGMKIDGARVDIGNFTLQQLITKAYDVKAYQVQGLSWMTPTAQRFDVVANIPAGATKDDVPRMLQALLAERFKLVVHRDSKDQNVYALVVAKGGAKIKQSAPPPEAEGAPAKGTVTGSSSVTINQSKGGTAEVSSGATRQRMIPSADGKTVRFEISGASMALLAEGLSPLVDRPIVDLTELKGDYDVAFDLSRDVLLNAARAAGAVIPPDAAGAPADSASDPGGTIFTAIQSLGLRLEPRKAPLVMIVVEKAEKTPSEN